MRILLVEDDTKMQIALKSSLEKMSYAVTVAGNGKIALDKLDKETFDLIISDQQMPVMSGSELLSIIQSRNLAIPFIMITAYGTINQAVEAMQLGASDFITKPFSMEDLKYTIERVLAKEELDDTSAFEANAKRPIITNDPTMKRVLEIVEAVAKSDATVLVQGESGTGKELIARLIHSSSPRKHAPFIAVNCAALPETLLESELFGHEKGAFTGAHAKKIGKFELSHGGTILLDEISEMELNLQAKLLRVLQEREVDRVGGKKPISVDVRVVATTNRDLEKMVKEGKFREDLYYRLAVIPVVLPPLRDRKGDIKLLVRHFMRKFLGNTAPVLPENVLNELESYSWPGNIRELQNAVQRAAILSQGRSVKSSDFLLVPSISSGTSYNKDIHLLQFNAKNSENAITIDNTKESPSMPMEIKSGYTVSEVERALILETLKSTNYNRTKAAKMLGISIRTLRNKLKEYKEMGIEI